MKSSDILRSVRGVIKQSYPAVPIYLNELTEEGQTPCFILQLVETTAPAGANKTQHICTMNVTYLDQKGNSDALALYDILDTIKADFTPGFQVADRFIHTESVSGSISGSDADMVEINIPFTYLDTTPTNDGSAGYLIYGIHTNLKNKGA